MAVNNPNYLHATKKYAVTVIGQALYLKISLFLSKIVSFAKNIIQSNLNLLQQRPTFIITFKYMHNRISMMTFSVVDKNGT